MNLHRFRPRFTYANVVATIALIIALGSGSATASRLITGTSIKNGSITGKDVRNGTLGTAKLASSTRSRLTDTSPWEKLPSGQTITGSFGTHYTATHNFDLRVEYMQLPVIPTVTLLDTHVSFAPAGLAPVLNTDATCNGTWMNPSAPAGKLCVYLVNYANVTGLDATAWGEPAPAALGAWEITWSDVDADAVTSIRAIWAYTAP